MTDQDTEDAYYAGFEDGELGCGVSPQQPGEHKAVYARYLAGYRDGQAQAACDRRNDGASREFWGDAL